MSWNYRVIRKTTQAGGKNYHSYSIYEVYYDERGKAVATSEEPILPHGETVIELMKDVYAMFRAFTHPILEWDLVFRKGLEPSMTELKQAPTITHPWVPPTKDEMRKIELEIERERLNAETTYRKDICEKTPVQIFEYLDLLK